MLSPRDELPIQRRRGPVGGRGRVGHMDGVLIAILARKDERSEANRVHEIDLCFNSINLMT